MHPDLIPDKAVKDLIRRQAQVPGFEDLARRTGRDTFTEIIRRQIGFILDAAEKSWTMSPEATELHAQWYPFAHRWLNELADINKTLVSGARDETGRLLGTATTITRPGAYGITAALSPRADWANNVAWAKRVIEAISRDVTVDESWIDAAYQGELERGRQLGRGGGAPFRRTDLIGKRLSQIEADKDVAYVLKAWHDAEPLKQLGGQFGFGNPANTAVPNDLGNLTKADSIARDGSVENIDRTLGGQKVRSFYNNLARPFDVDDLNVTIDTHHFGVANGIPFTATDPFMSSGSKNITETPWSDPAGLGGTYPLVVEATRQATIIFNQAHGTNYLPNQLQSVVWEWWRAEFDPDHRSIDMVEKIGSIRTARAKGRITAIEEARLAEAARLRYGAAMGREILRWFEADLAGEPRLTLTQMRPKKRR